MSRFSILIEFFSLQDSRIEELEAEVEILKRKLNERGSVADLKIHIVDKVWFYLFFECASIFDLIQFHKKYIF